MPVLTSLWQAVRIECKSASDETGLKSATYTTFCMLWRQLTPHTAVIKPISHLCWVCQKNSRAMRSANTPESLKSQVNKILDNILYMQTHTYTCIHKHPHVWTTHTPLYSTHPHATFYGDVHINRYTHLAYMYYTTRNTQ